MTEEWREIPGHPWYEVSDHGRVRSWKTRGKTLRRRPEPYLMIPAARRGGYLGLLLDGKNKFPHVLVLEAFVGPRPEAFHASHLNGDQTDNRLVNLAWETPRANNARKADHGTAGRGEASPRAKLTAERVAHIRSSTIPDADLAAEFGVSRGAVNHVRIGRTWKHAG